MVEHPSLLCECARCRYLGWELGARVDYATWACDVCGRVWEGVRRDGKEKCIGGA